MAIFHSVKKLRHAIQKGDEALVYEHLANTSRLQEWIGPLDDYGTTALMVAVEYNKPMIAAALIAAGAQTNAVTRSGRTALMQAARHKTPALAELLLIHGADAKHADNDGMSAFGIAVYSQRLDIAKLLLDHGADVHERKAFLRACHNADAPMMSMMIERGANPRAYTGDYGYHPVHYLAVSGCVDGFRILQSANAIAHIDARLTSDGNTPLHLAALNGHVGMIEALCAAGARRDLENNEGLTAEAAALKKDKLPAVKALQAAALDAAGQEKTETAKTPDIHMETGETWMRIGRHSVAQVQTIAPLHRRITHVFNFESREKLTISENLKTGAESTLPPQRFDEINRSAIDAAENALKERGGAAAEAQLDKPSIRKAQP